MSHSHIIFLHGNSSSATSFMPMLQRANLPYQTHLIEYSGHGNEPRREHYSYKALFEECLEKINQISGEKLLVGHSLGGHVAIEIAQNVIGLRGLLIFGTPPITNPPNFAEAFLPYEKTSLFVTPNPSRSEVDALFREIVLDSDSADLVKQDFLKTDSKFREALARDLTSGINPFQDEVRVFEKLPVKKYMLHGMQDVLVSFDYLQKLKERIENDFELIEIKNCGHYPTIEEPEIFAKHLERIAENVFGEEQTP